MQHLKEAERMVEQVKAFDVRQKTIVVKYCVPEDYELAKYDSLTTEEINGFNFQLRTELGFWDTLCKERMLASKFLVQTDVATFEELVRNSSLPCFTTDYVRNYESVYPGRVNIPLSDLEVNVTFYLVAKNEKIISAF